MGNGCSLKSKSKKAIKTSVEVDNSLLDRIGEGQIRMLMEKFKSYEQNKGLDLEGFKKLMPYITSLPNPVIENAFSQFANPETNQITWEGFCSAVSKYILGSTEDKCRFLYTIFDKNKNGSLKKKDATLLKSHIFNFTCSLKKIQQPSDDLMSLFSTSDSLSFNEFKTWAFINIDLHKALQPFEIIPSPNTEKERFKVNMQEFQKNGYKAEETYYLIYSPWLETWKIYVNYDEDSMPIIASYKSGRRPVAITNNKLLDPDYPEKLIPGLNELLNYTVLPKNVWIDFIKWYGGGPEIPRKAIKGKTLVHIETYPPLFQIYYYKDKYSSLSSKPKQKLISAYSTAASICEAIKNDIIEDEELCVYIKKDDKFEFLHLDTVIGNLELKDVNVCTVGFVSNSKSIENGVGLYNTDGIFSEGDAVECFILGKWLSAVIKRVTENNFTLSIWNNQSTIKISKRDTGNIRLPRKTLLTSKNDYDFCGLINLGNTCYLNSVLQVLLYSPLINEYFSNENFCNKAETLKVYSRFVSQFGKIFSDLKTPGKIKMLPKKLFKEFLMINEEFEQGVQNDSYELFQKILINLHEALCTGNFEMQQTLVVRQLNPSEEAKISKDQWELYRGIKGSIISAVFGAQTRYTLTCRSCRKSKSIFEVFNCFSIPIPSMPVSSVINLSIVTRNFSSLIQLSIKIQENMNFEDLLVQIDNKSPVKSRNLVFSHVHKGVCNRYFSPSTIEELIPDNKNELFGFEVITSVDDLENAGRFIVKKQKNNWREDLQVNELVDYFYDNQWKIAHIRDINKNNISITVHVKDPVKEIILRTSQNLEFFRKKTVIKNKILIIPATHLKPSKKIRKECLFFGIPYMISIGSWQTWHDLINDLKRVSRLFCQSNLDLSQVVTFYLCHKNKGSCGLCQGGCLGCKIPDNYETLENIAEIAEDLIIRIIWMNGNFYKPLPIKILPDEDIFSLQDCFAKFTEKEIIENKCEYCTETHQDSQIEIWRLPDLLILHLKRFRFFNSQIVKINTLVKFPLTNLDMSMLMLNSKKAVDNTVKNTVDNYMYDLYAVIDHDGNMSSGHNTAYCKMANGEWLLFDDDRVFSVNKNVEEEIVTSRAYVLCYKRQRFRSANIVKTMQS